MAAQLAISWFSTAARIVYILTFCSNGDPDISVFYMLRKYAVRRVNQCRVPELLVGSFAGRVLSTWLQPMKPSSVRS